MSLTCQKLLETQQAAWNSAIRHPFLDHCKTGEIKPSQFNTWLIQDYLFVVEFTRMVAQVLAAAPIAHFDAILGGLVALKDELNWFRDKAKKRHLNLNTEKQQTNIRYCQFMESLASEPYATQATAFWAIELAYNQAWQIPGPMAKPYDEFANRWGNVGFTEYVNLLEQQADEALKSADQNIQKKAEDIFLKVAQYEKLFWQMAFEG